MAYSYSKASSHKVVDGAKYFLDSNIWLKILSPKNKPTHKDRAYTDLFQRIIANNKVKIVVPALVLSEVINRLLREVHLEKFKQKYATKNPQVKIGDDFYKSVFRPSAEFKIAYNIVCDEIKNYHSSYELISDGFGTEIKSKHVLSNPPQSLDFNDHFYYHLCKNQNYLLVTDDKDFWIEGITVITMSDTLLEKDIAEILKAKNEKILG